MSRYLFGPVTAAFADQNLQRARRAGECLAFGSEGTDLAIGPLDTWETICGRFPDGWQPDLVVLHLAYTTIPASLWSAPVPLVGLAGHWTLLWHHYRTCLGRCDAVFTDAVGVETCTRQGMVHARPANLSGCDRVFLEHPRPEAAAVPRDIDILFVGSLHAAVQRERLAWLGRLARLGARWRVAIHTGVFGADYRALLARARIVFNRSSCGECNQRVGEAVAAGALVFQEADNREIRHHLRDCSECILYADDNLEALLDHYLEHEDERRALAEAARMRLPELSFEALWGQVLERIERDWQQIVARSRQRPRLEGLDDLLARTQELLSSAESGESRLATHLAAALVERPDEAAMHNALGLAVTCAAQAGSRPTEVQARTAAGYFRRALAGDPRHVLAGLNLAEALVGAGDMAQAAEQARRTLAVLEQEPDDVPEPKLRPTWLDEGHFPPQFDLFRVEWERAAWQHAGQPDREVQAKRNLMRWRLHTILADASGELAHYHEAALARPDLPVTRAALGCALARARRFPEAAPHLRCAVDANPFDLSAARALFDVLGEVGDRTGRLRLARDRRLLHQAAPALVPAEAWLVEPSSVGDERVQAKRRPEYPAGHQAPASLTTTTPLSELRSDTALQAPPADARLRVSLCMIVKNEEANLPACLESVAGLVDETVVVDTGSTDRTKEVAVRAGARVVDFPWVDSFAAARNEGLRHATGAWIFWLDADDRLDEDNRGKLRALFAGLKDENAAHVMKCLCLPDRHTNAATVVDHVRLFRNHPQVRWQYRVHEQILPAVRRLKGDVRWTHVVIHHTGYQDLAVRGRKLERDLRLLRLEDAEHPNDPFTLFNLGSVHQELRQPAEALPHLRRSLELSQPGDSIVRKLYALIVQCQRQLGEPAEALAICRAGRGRYPEDAELLFLEGLVLREHGDRAGAEAAWQRLLTTQEKAHFASIDAGLRGHKARQNLAVLYEEQGRHAEAEAQWRAVVADQPDFLPAWLGLGDLYLNRGRWREFEEVLSQLAAGSQWSMEAAVLRARRHLAAKEFAPARQVLELAISQAPQAVWPRMILSHVLLQEGQDWAAAEKALRDVLALDPGHAEAQRNLGVLLRQLGRLAI